MSNKRGFTTVELLVSFIIISFIAISIFRATLLLSEKLYYYQTSSALIVFDGTIANTIQKDLLDHHISSIATCGANCYDFTFTSADVKRLSIDKVNGLVRYGAYVDRLPNTADFDGDMTLVNRSFTGITAGRYNSLLNIHIPVISDVVEGNFDINIVYQYDGNYIDVPLPIYSESEGVNRPQLVNGMTAVKWDGNNWITVGNPDADTSWYNYANKEWANAKTADGSMWVWIPRFIYKISNGWHSNTIDTIDVKFSMNVDDTRGGSINIDNDSTANASNNKWTNQPAFNFGGIDVPGIWVAKFEATAAEGVANGYTADGLCPIGGDNLTTKTIKIVPNVTSWRCITIGNMFTATRNMETNVAYGWGTSGSGIDTHLMKNIEWGAVAYLTKSIYGQNTNDVWINPANNYTTGCAGASASSAPTTGCTYPYDNQMYGIKASTTGTIYGVYDMAGGSWEYQAAYVDNANGNLSKGSTITGAASQYKDIYAVGGTDDQPTNYELAISQKGDAVYETSNSSTGMAYTVYPWFLHGGHFDGGNSVGVLKSFYTNGDVGSHRGFRPVLVVGSGL